MVMLLDSDDDAALRSALRDVCSRNRYDQPTVAAIERLWADLTEVGTAEMALSPAAGGATTSQLGVVAEETGRHLASVGLVEHLVAIRFWSTCADSGATDPSAGLRATVALRPTDAGRWQAVVVGHQPAVALGVHGGSAGVLALPDSEASTCQHDILGFGDLTVGDQFVPLADAAAFAATLDLWRILTAAFLVGVSERVLAMTVDYVGTRRQFERPVGSFQAVQHGLADLPGMIAGARLLAAKAAWSTDCPEAAQRCDVARNDITDSPVLSSMALLFAAETATLAVDRAVHYHGAIGAAVETGLHAYYRLARSLPLLLGSLSTERRHLAGLLLEPTWTSH